ncbi:hypothetical protein DL96DRAFT_1823460 [Flagelloscypha sp. PMI_526]|nr:hypothetical protein DL96DRAFT_1823460 [Flagelloscypha sp. PMI_526]
MTTHVEKVKKAFTTFYTELDINAVTVYWADSYRSQILPESLGQKEQNREESIASLTKMLGNIKEYTKFEFVEIFENENKVTGHIRTAAILKDGTEYNNEAVFILTFEGEGKCTYFKQFNDSLATAKVGEKLRA